MKQLSPYFPVIILFLLVVTPGVFLMESDFRAFQENVIVDKAEMYKGTSHVRLTPVKDENEGVMLYVSGKVTPAELTAIRSNLEDGQPSVSPDRIVYALEVVGVSEREIFDRIDETFRMIRR